MYKRKGKKKYVAQQRVYLIKKEGIFCKSFAKQTDAFTVLNFRVIELKNLGSC